MTIDLKTTNPDDLVPLGEAGKFCPKPVSKTTLHKWAKQGLNGERLTTIYCGRQLHTTQQEVHRFFERVTERRLSDEPGAPSPDTSNPSRFERANAEAQRLGA